MLLHVKERASDFMDKKIIELFYIVIHEQNEPPLTMLTMLVLNLCCFITCKKINDIIVHE